MKRHILNTVSVVMSAAALLCCNSKENKSLPKDEEKVEIENTKEPSIPADDGWNETVFKWESDFVHSFKATLDSELYGADNALMIKMKVLSTAKLRAKTDGKEQLILLVLNEPTVTIDGASTPDERQLEVLTAELTQPVWGLYRGGKLQKMYFPTKPSAYAVGIWRTILSAIQMSMPLQGENTNTTTEYDGNGEASVKYVRTGEVTWTKTKRSYLTGLHAEDDQAPVGAAPSPKLIYSDGEISLQGGRLQSVSQKETVAVPLSGVSGLKGELTFGLNRIDTTPTKELFLKPEASRLVINASEPFVQELPIDAMDKERMKGLTFERTLNALVSKSRDPRKKALWASKNDEPSSAKDQKRAEEWTEDWARYFAALPAFFRQDPSALKRAEKEIREGNPATASLLGGLGSSGNPEAQEVLVRLVRDAKLSIELRESALRNLVQCAHPTKKSADAVREFMETSEFKRLALYGIGIMGRKLRKEGKPDEAGEVLSLLIDKLENTEDPHEKRDVLRGISNTGDVKALATIRPLLKSENPTIRGGAVEAVRLMETQEADEIIARHINHEKEPAWGVRVSAVKAASTRSKADPIMSALLKAASDDPELKAKKEVRKLLFSWSRDNPELTAKLEEIAEADERAEAGN